MKMNNIFILLLMAARMIASSSRILVGPGFVGNLTLREGVANVADGGEIWISAGEIQDNNNNGDYCGVALLSRRNVTIASVSTTILDCNYNSGGISIVAGTGIRLSGITFKHGTSSCVLISNSSGVVLMDVNVVGCVSNSLANNGTGISVVSSSDIVLSNVKMTSNINSNGVFGAGGYFFRNSGLVFHNVTVAGGVLNSAACFGGSGGAGLFLDQCSGVSMMGNTYIADNVLQLNCVENGQQQSTVYSCGAAFVSVDSLQISDTVVVKNNTIVANYYFLNATSPSVLVKAAGVGFDGCVSPKLIFSSATIADNTVICAIENARAQAKFQGSGACIVNSPNAVISGARLLLANNRILYTGNLVGNGELYGAGLCVYGSSGVQLNGAVSAIGNVLALSLTQSAKSFLFGAGVAIVQCDDVVWGVTGVVEMTNNSIDARLNMSAESYPQGCGLAIYSCNRVSISVDAFLVRANTVKSFCAASTYCYPQGAGIYIYSSRNIGLKRMTIRNNRVHSSIQPLQSQLVYSDADTNKCQTYTVIVEPVGSITTTYGGKTKCSWQLAPSLYEQAFGIFEARFTMLSTAYGYDFVFLYDGPTSFSPLIGKYSGSLQRWQCVYGRCPPPQGPIHTTVGQLFVYFQSDGGGIADSGFSLSWRMIEVNRTSVGTFGKLTDDLCTYPSFASGGGISISSSTVIGSNLDISENEVFDQFMAAGGGLYIESTTSSVTLDRIGISNNKIMAISSTGGGIVVISSAVLKCNDCMLDSNRAIAAGSQCFYSAYSLGIMCPSSYGGSLSVLAASVLILSNAIMKNNLASCEQYGVCVMLGGGIVIAQSSYAQISTFSCTNCSTSCGEAQFCPWEAGGCLYAIDAYIGMNGSSNQLYDNRVQGIGSGGAIFLAGTTVASLVNVLVFNNSARQGGAISLIQSSYLILSRCNISKNVAAAVGGAVALTNDASISIYSSTFDSNSASRASVMFSYNDNDKAIYFAEDTMIYLLSGSAVLMLGNFEMTASSNVWNCTFPGSVFSREETNDYYALTCIPCQKGTYSVNAASTMIKGISTCIPCPYGSDCLGSSQSSNGLKALGGFWGSVNNNGTATFYPCPEAYCCPVGDKCDYNFCAGNRIGKLCGQCPDGYGLRFFTEACGPNSDCHGDQVWLILIILTGASFTVVFLIKTTGKQSSGILSVLLYFYQVLPFVKSTPWKHTPQLLLTILQSLFNISPTSSATAKGICLMQSMQAWQKLGARALLHSVVFAMLIVAFAIHYQWSRSYRKISAPSLPHYLATFVRLLTIAYTTLVLVPLQMVQCTWIDGEKVWWYDANVVCFEDFQIGSLVVIAVLLPLPFIVIFLLLVKYPTRQQHGNAKLRRLSRVDSAHLNETWLVLTNGFQHKRRYWLGISLYRRLLMVLVYVMIADNNWKAMATSTLCWVFVLFNVIMKPFQNRTTHICETVSLAILGVLSVTDGPRLSQMQFGTSEQIDREMELEWIQFLLAMIPALVYTILVAIHMKNVIVLVYGGKRDNVSGSSKAATTGAEVEVSFHDIVECNILAATTCPLCNESYFKFNPMCEFHQYC